MTDAHYESVLMRRVRGGDREGFEQLVRIYSTGLLTFIHRTSGDYHQSEELFQEVFLAVWKRRHTYKFPGPVRAWLYRIALNVVRESWRKARLPMDPTEGVEQVTRKTCNDPAKQAMDNELASAASEAVLCLPMQQRTVVALRIWNHMTYREIAGVMELTEATVRSHMHHALRTLRQQLTPRVSND